MSGEVTGANNSTSIDWSNMAGSFVSAGSGLLGSLIAGAYNRKRQRESQSWAESMWNKQNDYNLPKNQMIRLQEAGINPNLAFGSAASAMASGVGSVPHYSESPDFAAPVQRGISEYFSRRFERQMALNQIKLAGEQAREKEMANDTMSLLLDDYRAMKRSEYNLGALRNSIDSQLYSRKANLEVDLLSSKWLNDIDRFTAHLPITLANHYRAQDALLRNKTLSEYEDFLTKRSKGRFERGYYDRGLNPYETSTVAGALRTILGLGENLPSNGLPPDYFSPNPKTWFNWHPQGSPLYRGFDRVYKWSINKFGRGTSFRW